jgi:uncharacterized protein YrrD
MEFKAGTHVYTADGNDVGSIDRVILDPHTNEISGIVVKQGWLFTEDKVVSIDLVASASESRVVLSQTKHNLHDLPPFEETYYVPLQEEDYPTGLSERAVAHADYAPVSYAYPPLGTEWWGYGGYLGLPPAEPTTTSEYGADYIQRTKTNIPEGTIAVKEGARVLSIDNQHVGDVEEVFIDPQSNFATHILIAQGHFFKEHKLVPTNWIKSERENEVRLTVNTAVVERLPSYQPQP